MPATVVIISIINLCGGLYYVLLHRLVQHLEKVAEFSHKIITKNQKTGTSSRINNDIMLIAKCIKFMQDNARKKSEQLVYERNQFNMILTQIPEGIIITDTDHKLIRANRTAELMFGFSTDQASGQKIMKSIKDKSFSNVFKQHLSTKTNNEPMIHAIKIPNAPSQKSHFQLISTPLLDPSYEAIGTIIMIRNISNEKTKDDQRNSALSLISNDLKTPLTSIIGLLDILSKETYGQLSYQQRECVSISSYNAKYLKQLIHNVQELSLLYSKQTILSIQTFNLNHMMNLIRENLATYFTQKSNQCDIEIQHDQLTSTADPPKIKLLLENLLLHANKHTDNGTIKCTINQTDAFTTFIVKDSGKGMNEASRYTLYKLMEQTPTALENHTDLSIELSIVRGFTHLHHGQIFIESEPAQGTTFTVIIPHPNMPSEMINATKSNTTQLELSIQ